MLSSKHFSRSSNNRLNKEKPWATSSSRTSKRLQNTLPYTLASVSYMTCHFLPNLINCWKGWLNRLSKGMAWSSAQNFIRTWEISRKMCLTYNSRWMKKWWKRTRKLSQRHWSRFLTWFRSWKSNHKLRASASMRVPVSTRMLSTSNHSLKTSSPITAKTTS